MEFLVPEGYEPDELHPYAKQNKSDRYCEIVEIHYDTVQTHCGTYDQKELSELCLFPAMPYNVKEYCKKCRIVVEALKVANNIK